MAFETDIFGGCEGLIFCLARWSNEVTQGMHWSLILMALGVVLFMATFNFGVARAFGYASMGVSLSSLLLVQMGLIPSWMITLTIIIGIVGVAMMFNNQKGFR